MNHSEKYAAQVAAAAAAEASARLSAAASSSTCTSRAPDHVHCADLPALRPTASTPSPLPLQPTSAVQCPNTRGPLSRVIHKILVLSVRFTHSNCTCRVGGSIECDAAEAEAASRPLFR